MLYNIIPIILFFGSVTVVIGIVLRRLPDIASIRVETIAEAKAAATKRSILIDRLRRKFMTTTTQLWVGTTAHRAKALQTAKALATRLQQLEKTYRPMVEKKQEPKTVAEMLVRANELREQERYGEAEKLYLECIRVDHRSADAYFGLGVLYQLQEEYAQARQSLAYATRLRHNDPAAYVALARVEIEETKYADARAAFAKAIELEPEVIEHRIELGDVAMMEKDYDAAVEAYQGAVAKEPSNPRCLDRLLESSILLGNKRLAVDTLRTLTDVNPENQKLLEFRQRVAELGSKGKKRGSAS